MKEEQLLEEIGCLEGEIRGLSVKLERAVTTKDKLRVQLDGIHEHYKEVIRIKEKAFTEIRGVVNNLTAEKSRYLRKLKRGKIS